MEVPFSLTPDTFALPTATPVPDGRVLPTYAYLLRGRDPVLVDTGHATDVDAFVEALDTVVDVRAVRAVLLTHEDADHAGALAEILERAPRARLVTTATGFGKLGAALRLDPSRVELVRPGSQFTVGASRFQVLRPPMYDSPATLAFVESTRRMLFTSDAFGAFVSHAAESEEALDTAAVLEGMSAFCRANSPWITSVQRDVWATDLHRLATLDVDWVLGSHLPPTRRARFGAYLSRAVRMPDEGEVPMVEHITFEATVSAAAGLGGAS